MHVLWKGVALKATISKPAGSMLLLVCSIFNLAMNSLTAATQPTSLTQPPVWQKGVVPKPMPTTAPAVVKPQATTVKVAVIPPGETNEQRMTRLKAYLGKFDIKKQPIGKSTAVYHRQRKRRRKKARPKRPSVTTIASAMTGAKPAEPSIVAATTIAPDQEGAADEDEIISPEEADDSSVTDAVTDDSLL
jgi:hypothetical protein